MTNLVHLLEKNPNAIFGILVALEEGGELGAMAERAGITHAALEELVTRARNGDLRRVGASKGEASVFTVPSPQPPSLPDRKPVPVALPAPAREEPIKMTEVMPAGIGARPDLAWVDVTLIDVDKSYQRDADRKSVAKIVADFRWEHFGAVALAAKPDGRFNCTDGQHRVLAALEHPDVTEVPAVISALDGSAAEAENFLTINRSRRAVSTIEIYWAGIASNDPATLRVRDAIEAAGCSVVRSQANYKPGQTGAVTAIGRCLLNYGDDATIRALKVVRKAWPNDAKALRGSLITALARIYRANDVVNDERMIKVLAPRSFAELTAGAEAFRKLSGGSADTVLARTITEIFNKGLSTNTIFFGESR